MSEIKNINGAEVHLLIGDITDMEVEAFVFYCEPNLKLGAGFGNAISMRAGLAVQKACNEIGKVEPSGAVITEAGKLKSKNIVHANGPKFQELDTGDKLKKTMINAMKAAQDKGITQIAFPAMGAGFYGVPLALCAEAMFDSIKQYTENSSNFKEIKIVLLDNREYRAFKPYFDKF
jgi:O-acetyl-ADP-ribose deacetylase (regulator of RNase III)